MSSEGTAPGKSETFGEDSAMASERLAVRGWSSGETGARGRREGGAERQATAGQLLPEAQRHQGAGLLPQSLQSSKGPWRTTGALLARPHRWPLGLGKLQGTRRKAVPGWWVATAARRGHGLRGRGSTAQGRR